MTNKEKFLSICREEINRSGIEALLDWLENKSDFFEAPASTRFHGNYVGGLCEHSLNVYHCLRESIAKYPDINVSNETIAISALFHDICKVNFYILSSKNQLNKETGKWEKVPFYEIDEKFPCGDHADKSIIILQSYMKLLPEEILAIRSHMGGFDTTVKGGGYMIGKIFSKSKFAVLLHLADLEATYLLEG